MVDKELLSRLVVNAQKDINEFDKLYDYVVKAVYYWCYDAIGDWDTAKDVMQESMVKIAKNLNTLKEPEKFMNWAYVVTKNTSKTYRRINQNSDKTMDVNDETYGHIVSSILDETSESRPDETFKEKQKYELVVSFVNNLPKVQKEVITLFYLEEFSVNEIAEILNSKSSTIKSHLFLGRKNLKKQISMYQETNDVRLYGTSILVVLGTVLNSFREGVCSKVDLSFEKVSFMNAVSDTTLTLPNDLLQTTAKKINYFKNLMLSTTTLAIIGIAGKTLIDQMGGFYPSSSTPNHNYLDVLTEDESLIKSATVEESQTPDGLPVRIDLNQVVDGKDISVEFQGTNIPFTYSDQVINLVVKQNGTYKIYVKDSVESFQISSVEYKIPKVTGVKNEGSFLQFEIDDSEVAINYEKSYLIAQGNEYTLQDDNKVQGKFKGKVDLYLYSSLDQFISYSFEIK